MLTALELAGFKSFAEKTRFDFPDGITVIVGPNGSGKSNVVDAIKWVLGAQSAKALRGKDMIDVIFKGSSSAGRKPGNSAEATLVFDNSTKKLALETDEVSVTRRVYRSGEGEYLINGQACRLKDIKSLFQGTGVGVDAYSLIEQGKVDRMLQASPRDRRIIFEEAAGISRFNAKKAEAARRLGRVEQNLTRLKDIVDEVHGRLNRLKSQASKAQRFREMSSRLQELRTRLGWTEYHTLRGKLQKTEDKLLQVSTDLTLKETEVEEAREAAQQAELELHQVARACQEVESRLQEAQQQIAVGQNQQNAIRTRIEDCTNEQVRQTSRLSIARSRSREAHEAVQTHSQALSAIQTQFETQRAACEQLGLSVSDLRQEHEERLAEHSAQREQISQLAQEHLEQTRDLADKQQLLSSLNENIHDLETQCEENSNALNAAERIAQTAGENLAKTQESHTQAVEDLQRAKSHLGETQAALAQHQEQCAMIKGKLVGASERLQILDELQRHLDGVDGGARFLLEQAKSDTDPIYATIHGLVAELLHVDVQLAELIDTALGTNANLLILEDGQLIQRIRNGELKIPGRLSLMRLDRIPSRRFGEKVQLDGVHGVVGRADRLVRCKNRFMPLIRYLLGTTWVVESLDIALELGHFRGAGLRFVTQAGELIESDGTLTIGAIQSASGLISRQSEMHDARKEIANLEQQHASASADIHALSEEIRALTPNCEKLEARVQDLSVKLARQQALTQNAVDTLDGLRTESTQLSADLESQSQRRNALLPTLSAAKEELEKLTEQLRSLELLADEHKTQIEATDHKLKSLAEEETSAKVALARVEQQFESAQSVLQQNTQTAEEREQIVLEIESEIAQLQTRQQRSELEILQLTSQLAETYLVSEAEDQALSELAINATTLRTQYQSTTKQLETANRALDRLAQQQESLTTDQSRFADDTKSLRKRYLDDYQISFDDLSNDHLIEDPNELQAMDAEATQLRQDLASVGEINMAALAELDELQERYDRLNGQYEDLQAAKESLQRIIQKINQDSRRMFVETLEVIRQNFKVLYRKSFGGGNADIVLDEADDVLDCGIDIIATPPGKTALSNSLLSGGEKALTAVALLLAIFQYRPSPFCVLDEVDAPFDEANIGRFVNVLTEFLDWTKFIIVTHSKKTMTASNTLYGVTMQESGVSKQVAVRFEDVNDKGEIIDHKRAA